MNWVTHRENAAALPWAPQPPWEPTPYRPLPKDQTIVRLRIVQPVMVLGEARAVGDVVPVPRWLADELVLDVPHKVERL